MGVYNEDATDLLIISYANGLRLSLRAAKRLEDEHGIRVRVLDLRWLVPLPFDAIEEHATACDAVLVADESRSTGGGISDAVIAYLAKRQIGGKLGSVEAADCYIPLGPAANLMLLSEDDIYQEALAMKGVPPRTATAEGANS